jgi:small multidrug resistance family-3 protein
VVLPGIGSLVVFALLPSRIEMDFAQRAYAAYGDVRIVASLVWL